MIEIPKLIACSYAYYLKYYKLIKKWASHDYLVTHRLGKLINQLCVCAQLCPTLCNPWTVAHQAPLSMGFSGKNTGLCCHFLFQGIFPTQGLNPHLLSHLHSRHTLYHWAQGSPNKNITTHLKILYVWTYILILGETHNHHSLSLSIPHTHHTQWNAILKRSVLYTFQWTISFYGDCCIHNSRITHLRCEGRQTDLLFWGLGLLQKEPVHTQLL